MRSLGLVLIVIGAFLIAFTGFPAAQGEPDAIAPNSPGQAVAGPGPKRTLIVGGILVTAGAILLAVNRQQEPR